MRKGEPGSSPSLRYGATSASNYSSLTWEQLEIGSKKNSQTLDNEERLSFRMLFG